MSDTDIKDAKVKAEGGEGSEGESREARKERIAKLASMLAKMAGLALKQPTRLGLEGSDFENMQGMLEALEEAKEKAARLGKEMGVEGKGKVGLSVGRIIMQVDDVKASDMMLELAEPTIVFEGPIFEGNPAGQLEVVAQMLLRVLEGDGLREMLDLSSGECGCPKCTERREAQRPTVH